MKAILFSVVVICLLAHSSQGGEGTWVTKRHVALKQALREDARLFRTLRKDANITILEQAGPWFLIDDDLSDGQAPGWVHGDEIELVGAPKRGKKTQRQGVRESRISSPAMWLDAITSKESVKHGWGGIPWGANVETVTRSLPDPVGSGWELVKNDKKQVVWANWPAGRSPEKRLAAFGFGYEGFLKGFHKVTMNLVDYSESQYQVTIKKLSAALGPPSSGELCDMVYRWTVEVQCYWFIPLERGDDYVQVYFGIPHRSLGPVPGQISVMLRRKIKKDSNGHDR